MTLAKDNSLTRRRRAHTKSRRGCGNCKLRRVKCDETRPRCQKCLSFGVSCDYESKSSELQVSGMSSFQIQPGPNTITPPETPSEAPVDGIEELIDGMMNAPLRLHLEDGLQGADVCYIDLPHLDLLRKFYRRSVFTIGTADSVHVYRGVLTRMATKHSFVLHAVLRFVLMHDRYVYDSLGTPPSAAEAFHGYHAAALFGKKLCCHLEDDEKDAVWGTAALLGASAFAEFDGTSPQDTWPLNKPDLSDMDWLKMSEGKKEVWKLTDPLREGGAFKEALNYEHSKKQSGHQRPMNPELDKLFPYVTKFYNLDSPRSNDDPYHEAASIIERLLPIECSHHTIMWFLAFIGHMQGEYRQLLQERDPAAMLLLAWWYAKMIPYGVWWITRRGWFECQAICMYLDNTLPPDHDIRMLLEFPRSVCGLDDTPAEQGEAGAPFPWPRSL